jgi:CheY-like chemotaxis protein
MPVMDGWQFLEEWVKLKPKIGKKITIYLSTSSISPVDILRAKEIAEVTDIIFKPITIEKLIDIIKNL